MHMINIAVCAKPVPDPSHYDKVKIDPVKKTIIRSSVPTIINPVDKNAIEEALMLKQTYGGNVTVLSMAPPDTENEIRKLLAMGADDAYLISDKVFAGSDTLGTSHIIAGAIRQIENKKNIKFDLVICGSESADGGTSQVPPQLGEWLSLNHLENVMSIEQCSSEDKFIIKTKIENGIREWKCKLPIVLAVSRDINTPRFTSIMSVIKAKIKPLSIISSNDIENIDINLIGLEGSPTKPGELYEPQNERSGVYIEGSIQEKAVEIINSLKSHGIIVRT